ncbi:unnamed protein product [Polarella glacialis]|uniref:EF-hand domain-containing protein n=2 Tax=Polarella glacialis TaxID=89957 RepID=A0A813G414_POLGL|nr:unnamed protein product [Polarella glacialis]
MAPKKPKRTNKPSPLDRMHEAFALLNNDGDTMISKEEFRKGLATVGVTPDVADQLFKRFDPDGSGQLDKEEFFAYAAKGTGEMRRLIRNGLLEADEGVDAVLEAFRAWDVDGDGRIDPTELERVLVLLNPSFTKTDMTKMMKAIDKNKDGSIDYEEFTDWIADKKPMKK